LEDTPINARSVALVVEDPDAKIIRPCVAITGTLFP